MQTAKYGWHTGTWILVKTKLHSIKSRRHVSGVDNVQLCNMPWINQSAKYFNIVY